MIYNACGEAYDKVVKPQMFEMIKTPYKYYNLEFIRKKLKEIEKKLLDVKERLVGYGSYGNLTLKSKKTFINAKIRVLLLERKKIHFESQDKMITNKIKLDDIRDILNDIEAKIKQESET